MELPVLDSCDQVTQVVKVLERHVQPETFLLQVKVQLFLVHPVIGVCFGASAAGFGSITWRCDSISSLV